MGNDYSHTDSGNYPSGPIYNPSTPQNPQPPSGQPPRQIITIDHIENKFKP